MGGRRRSPDATDIKLSQVNYATVVLVTCKQSARRRKGAVHRPRVFDRISVEHTPFTIELIAKRKKNKLNHKLELADQQKLYGELIQEKTT
jgi:hypothetical protein